MKEPLGRPVPKELFACAERCPEVYFYTSNVDKFIQARLVFGRYGLDLRHFRSRVDPYHEDYGKDTEGLLTQSLNEVIGTLGMASIVFVEDTSIRIDALSGSVDFPGAQAKEWFGRTSLQELRDAITAVDGPNAAIVKSDVALHLPGLSRPVFFHGETSGTIADVEPDFAASSQYPWLTPRTFNGWFVPAGQSRRLGEMSFEESWPHDFRVRALSQLIERLEEYSAALNLAPPAYRRRPESHPAGQLAFWPSPTPVLVVVGRMCAGKTTLGDHASARHGLRVVEASGVVKALPRPTGPLPVDPFEYAKLVLAQQGADAVAQWVIKWHLPTADQGLVVTGFRTIEEVEAFKAACPHAAVVGVGASDRIRYARYLARKRDPESVSFVDFLDIDTRQASFGLLRVAPDIADCRILNEGSLEAYHEQIDALVRRLVEDVPSVVETRE